MLPGIKMHICLRAISSYEVEQLLMALVLWLNLPALRGKNLKKTIKCAASVIGPSIAG